MTQSLRAQGINADFHSVKKTDYDTLMTSIYDTRLRGYWNSILVEEELLKLRLFSNNKIDHPNSGSKDLADALAGSVFNAIENMAIETEVEIEILGNDSNIDYEIDEFKSVNKYDHNLREFVPGFSETKIQPEEEGLWMQNL